MRFTNNILTFSSNLNTSPSSARLLKKYLENFENKRNFIKNSCVKFAFGRDGFSSDYAQILRQTFRRVTSDSEEVLVVCARQSAAIGGQRVRKAVRMNKVYKNTYDKSYLDTIGNAVKTFCVEYRLRFPAIMSLVSLASGAVINNTDDEDETLDQLDSELSLIPNENCTSVEELDTMLQDLKWEKSFSLPNLIGWRREKGLKSGLFEYKMFCRFDDVTARCFYLSQVDLEYRRQWDDRVVRLDVIDKDDNNEIEVLRWVTRFPWPMTSREYIFVRKSKIDYAKNIIVLIQHNVEHPSYPMDSDSKQSVRVEEYTSNWVIRPHKSFDENGCDFIFTYFDDPKGSFPSSASKWAARKGVPSYVESMHKAAQQYQENGHSRALIQRLDSSDSSIIFDRGASTLRAVVN